MTRCLLPLLLGSALLLAGCGGGDDDEPSSTPSSETTTTSNRTSDCPYVNPEDVGAVLDEQVSLVAGGEGGCTFIGGDYTLTVTYVQIGIDPAQYSQEARNSCNGPITEVDAGDDAYACVAFAPQGFLYVGKDSWVVQVTGATDDAAGVALAAELLPSVGR